MGAIDPNYTFTATDVITSTKMNNILDQSTITATAIFNSTLSIASGKLLVAAGGVTSNELGANAVTTTAILDANVTAGKLSADSVITAKILDSNVTAPKLATDSVETAKIKNANVTAAKLDGAQTGTAPIFGARAWVRFNGNNNTSGTADASNTNRQILGSGNVSSVLKNATGDYTVTFTTALPSANYVAVGQRSYETGNSSNVTVQAYSLYPQTVSEFRLLAYSDGAANNSQDVQLVFFG
jgi:hypothetical protein